MALIRHPDERRKLIADPGKLTVAVEELLRWVTPIKNMNRTAARDTELRGQKIREGDRLLLLYHSGNRDERAFESPDAGAPAGCSAPRFSFFLHFCLDFDIELILSRTA